MTRSIPEVLLNPTESQIKLSRFDLGMFTASFEYSVVNFGTTTELTYPNDGDSYSWRAAGDRADYVVTCEGMSEIVEGGFPLNRWRLSQKALVPEVEDKEFFIDVPDAKVYVFEEDGLRPARFSEINELVNAYLDFQHDKLQRIGEKPFHIVGGVFMPNLNYHFSSTDSSTHDFEDPQLDH